MKSEYILKDLKYKKTKKININDKGKINNIINNNFSNMNCNLVIIILILIIQIFAIFIKRKSLKNCLREDKIKDKKKKTKKNKYLDINNKSIRINIIKIINYIKIFIIQFLLINICKQIKSNVIFFTDSKITLKIKDSGEHTILGSNFQAKNYLKEININGNTKEIKTDCEHVFEQTDNFVELIFNDKINNCDKMFSGCNNIEINFSNFDTSKVENMEYMFYDCSSLISLNLSNFDTSQVTSMQHIFHDCTSLISLDLSNFNTSKVENMESMFEYCSALISLDLSNFDTSQVTTMMSMFEFCSSLISLNLSNFDASSVEDMDFIFGYCSSLISLNSSNFYTLKIKNTNSMFYNSFNLEYINLYNFKENSLTQFNDMFEGVPINVVICINENNIENLIQELSNLDCRVFDCSDNWKSNQLKIINNTKECIISCDQNQNSFK